METFSFKQQFYKTSIKYVNGVFEYIINVDSGERKEEKNYNKVLSKYYNFIDFIKLKFSKSYIDKLKVFLNYNYETLKKLNIDFSVFTELYNEKVIINEDKEDIRVYGFCKVVMNCNNHTFINDISIKDSDPGNLENDILKIVNENIKNIKFCTQIKKEINLSNIPVVFSPISSGYFIHEILGHSLENDFFLYYKDNFNDLKISKKLSVNDSISGCEFLTGLNKYDDVGTVIKPMNVIKNGKLNNIFSINKENSFDKKLYGFARRENYKKEILPRMRCTFIDAFDDMGKEEIISKYKFAVYFDKAYVGGVNPKTGDYFINGFGFLIKNGEKVNFIDNLILNGNLQKNLNSFEYIGNDVEIVGGFCSKLDQTIRVATGGPTMSLQDMSVKGDIYGSY